MVGSGVGAGGVGVSFGWGVGNFVGRGVGEDPPEVVGTLDGGGVGLVFGDNVVAGFAVVTCIVGLTDVVIGWVTFEVG